MPLVEPPGFLWLLTVIGAAWLAWKRRWSGALALLLLAALASLGGTAWLTRPLVASLERPYAPVKVSALPVVDAVVVLGGSHRPSDNEVFGFDLSQAADRILTAVELMRQRKAGALVLGGGNAWINGQDINVAMLLKPWLAAWNLPGAPVHYLDHANNTRQEALQVKALADTNHWQSILLVTSATHMRRAEAVFKQTGLLVIPVACDFRAHGLPRSHGDLGPVPRLEYFDLLGNYAHEELGWLIYRFEGWIDRRAASPATEPH